MANNMPRQFNRLDGQKGDLVANRSFGCEKRCPKADNIKGESSKRKVQHP